MDGNRIRKEKVADSKISGYKWTRPYSQEKITDSHYFRVFKEYPQKSQLCKSETSPNQETWLALPLVTGFVQVIENLESHGI